jgi:predicted dinucleotide-binding enzyme
VRFGIFGTGVVGKTIAARLTGLGHEVVIGTREPEETMSRTEPDAYGNPPFGAWQEEHRKYASARSDKLLPTLRWSSTPPPVPSH